jgi:16S rRNA C967 or C1407 C5-methylase (RsmB/RsmF family)
MTSSKSDLFREHHFFTLLETYDLSRGSLDFFVSSYFRQHPQLGSKDRLYISGRFFRYMRQKSLVDALHENQEEPILSLLEEDLSVLLEKGQDLPPYIRYSCPQELYMTLQKSLGDKTDSICQANMTEAPLFIRTNPIKTTRALLQQKLQEAGIETDEVPDTEYALRLKRRANLFSLPIFQEGWFECQDVGSQKIAELVQVKPKQKALDYCSGSGGKALAFAAGMQGQGQLFLHDIRNSALLEAKKRLRRAGIQNVQWILADETKKLQKMKGVCDWVLVDAPCSGTGTLRRNPDMKWRWTKEMLERIREEQRSIFEKALFFLKPNGSIIYATCSVLTEENQEQVAFFVEKLGLEQTALFQSFPVEGGMDGFFAAVLRKKVHS